MKKHLTENLEIRSIIFEGLKDNEGYCPCIYDDTCNLSRNFLEHESSLPLLYYL